MFHKINGTLNGVNTERLRQLRRQLEPLGYEFTADMTSFKKQGTIESAVNELVPICEELGWNTEHDLKLTESGQDPAYTAKFENGRVIRKFPRGV